jgi:small subunit ribosomal protein S9
MATKKTVKEENDHKENVEKKVPYFYAVGKRKTAVAQVKIFAASDTTKEIKVNGKKLEDYFPIARLSDVVKAPFLVTGQQGKFEVMAKVSGGGINAQAEAIRLGIAKSLVKFDETLKKSLRDRGFMTRDSRIVERKKPGLKKARKSPQWAKR